MVFSNSYVEETEEPVQPKAIIPVYRDWRFRRVITPVHNQSILASSPAIAALGEYSPLSIGWREMFAFHVFRSN